jgi:hypothetical protein
VNSKDLKSSVEVGLGARGVPGGEAWYWPGAVCAAVLVGVAILQALVPYMPDPYWNGDPRAQALEGKITELIPVSYIVMNLVAILAAFAGLVAHRLKGGALSGWVLVPTAMGALAALYVGAQDDEAVRALGWAAAAFGAASAWHLAQRPRERGLMVGALVGICVLLLIKALFLVFIDFPSGQAYLREHMGEILQARGWTPESSQAQAYVRRATQMEATGAYGLSNVYGSVMAALAFVGVGVTVGVARRVGWGLAALPGIAAAGALVCLGVSFSKGAMVAMAGVVAFGMLAGLVIWKWPKRPAWLLPAAAVALLAAGFTVVIVRGAVVGPPATIKGERSLLFRYQYWVGAARMAQELPAEKLAIGISQEGFRAAYPRVKVPINPEEVASTHNFWIDYSLMLGLGGLAWSLLLVGWMARGVSQAQQVIAEGVQDKNVEWAGVERRGMWAGLLVAGLVFVPVYVIQLPIMLPETLLSLFVGLGAVAVVIGVVTTRDWVDRRWMGAGLALAGVVLLFHGQIEMTFSTPGALAMAWLIMALAGSGEGRDSSKGKNGAGAWLGAVAAVAVIAGVGVWMVQRGEALVRQQKALALAAETLAKNKDLAQGAGLLQKAVEIYPGSPKAARNLIDFATEGIVLMGWGKASTEPERARAMSWVMFGEGVLSGLPAGTREGHQVSRSEGRMRYAQYKVLNDNAALAEARRLLEKVVVASPYDWSLREELADICEQQGDKVAALGAYEACLKLSEQNYLDETRVMSEAQRARVEGKVRALKGE